MTVFLKIKTRSTGLVPAVGPANERPPLAAALIHGLADAGFEACFGIPGRHVQSLFHFLPEAGFQSILARHEQGAVYMADGYARVTGQPALVIGTAGPGAANMVTGVANAFADGVPVLCITGAPARHMGSLGAFQELGDDHTCVTPAIFAPITRYNAQLNHPQQLAPTLRLSLTALAEGGPVNLSIPSDVLETPVAPTNAMVPVEAPMVPDGGAVVEAARLLSEHPDALILAGRGALEAGDALLALAEKLQIPVITTVHGRGAIDEDHPLALGAQGFSASHWAEQYLANRRPAVVLAVGTAMREISTNVYHEAFGGTVALIHVTRDAKAIGRHYQPTVAAVSDARLFLEALLPHVPARKANRNLAAFKAATPRYDEVGLAESELGVSPRRVVEHLRERLGPDDMLFIDTGNAIPWSVRYYPVHKPGTYFASLHLAAMGWGLAAAIGGAAARPESRVVALVGDGCFQMSGMEIATAVQHELPVVWVVLNDARLNMVFQGSERYYGNAVVNTVLSPIDAARVAEGLGAVGYHVNRLEDLASTLDAALACGRPAVVDVAIDPTLEPPMAGRAAAMRRFEQRG